VVFVDHAAEYFPALHRSALGHGDRLVVVRWSLAAGLVRPVAVVVVGVSSEHGAQVSFIVDQQPGRCIPPVQCVSSARHGSWTTPSTTPCPDDRYRRVRVTHRFHPLFGLVARRQNWGEDRVHLHDENGVLFSLPAGWTDVAAADPFVVIGARPGRDRGTASA